MADPTSPVDWRAQFVLLAAIWGSSFLFIKVLGERWPPLWVALGPRLARGDHADRDYIRTARAPEPSWTDLVSPVRRGSAVERHPVHAVRIWRAARHLGVAGLWNATTPLWVLSAAVFVFGEERLSRDRVLGLLTVSQGSCSCSVPGTVSVMASSWDTSRVPAPQLCYGLAWPYMRRYLIPRSDSVIALAAGQLLCATAILALAAPLATGLPTRAIGNRRHRQPAVARRAR